MSEIGVLSIQMNSVAEPTAQNLSKVEKIIRGYTSRKIDLIVLPEFFSTNTSYMQAIENEYGGQTINQVCELAKRYNTNIVAGTVVRRIGNKLYNTSFAINRNGKVLDKYDKLHLFSYMGGTEGDHITAGNRLVAVDFDFGRVGLAIGFDSRYPLQFKELSRLGSDIIVLPTAWLVPNEVFADKNSLAYARNMWTAMSRTRAYDNEVYYVISNQVGQSADNNWAAIGQSMIISPTSEVLAEAVDEEQGIYAKIDLSLPRLLKGYFPIAEQE